MEMLERGQGPAPWFRSVVPDRKPKSPQEEASLHQNNSFVKRQKGIKLWLHGDHVELSANLSVNRRGLSRLTRIAEDNQQRFLDVWNDFFGS